MCTASSIHQLEGFHRDIKPDNLLATRAPEDGRIIIKLGDFGLARVPVASSGPMTRSPAGTPNYIAPELSRHDRDRTANRRAQSVSTRNPCGPSPAGEGHVARNGAREPR
ncbi:protein kinase domain-containing protein [Nannocystis bainbridge]|uniref:protein kinase domain-containing protein n=1 Tax=Nannocystis bainbridge TaxID=2995303 RepID=UPI00358DAB78